MKDAVNYISAESIKSSFYNQGSKLVASSAISAHSQQEQLTTSAKYIVKECRKRMGQQSALVASSSNPDVEDLANLVKLVENSSGEELTNHERQHILASLSSSLDNYDILTPLINNSDINDIIIRSYKDISVQMGRGNVQTDISFPDHETYKSFIENLLKRCGKACTVATPVVDAAPEQNIRACVTHESFSPPGSGPMLTMRISRHKHISLDSLAGLGLAPDLVLKYLGTVISTGKHSILLAGEVGTGKTTLVRALAQEMDEQEAILIIEDTNEIVLNRNFVRTLLTREANTEGVGRISPAQAIHTGMRMAMNRIILGEMRSAEAAEAFIDVCASGHAGISTLHARSAKDAISRLELFLARAQGNISTENIRRQIANAISVVVYLGLDKETRKRRIMEVVEIGSSSDGVVQVSPMFSYRHYKESPAWLRDGGISQFASLLKAKGINLPLPGNYMVAENQIGEN
ncbi:MAG: CpaF family protein [Deltaproteobacteria bacterium]|nr:CpaF family protein [Deltaproteobacteria bacterium]